MNMKQLVERELAGKTEVLGETGCKRDNTISVKVNRF
jgi:hypothetical protein